MEKPKKLAIRKFLKNLDSSLFDGHTEFKNFTNEQKINWLMQISFFILEAYFYIGKERKMY